jgi:hypothetical protein
MPFKQERLLVLFLSVGCIGLGLDWNVFAPGALHLIAKSIPNGKWIVSLFYNSKKPLLYFNYPFLQNNSHLILYFTIHHIKIL